LKNAENLYQINSRISIYLSGGQHVQEVAFAAM